MIGEETLLVAQGNGGGDLSVTRLESGEGLGDQYRENGSRTR